MRIDAGGIARYPAPDATPKRKCHILQFFFGEFQPFLNSTAQKLISSAKTKVEYCRHLSVPCRRQDIAQQLLAAC